MLRMCNADVDFTYKKRTLSIFVFTNISFAIQLDLQFFNVKLLLNILLLEIYFL